MAVWMKLVVFITLLVTTSGANQNDCMTPLLDVSSVFGLGNLSSPSLAEYPGETNQSCIYRCCQSDSCNIVKFRFSTSDASPNCVLYSCQPTNSCYLVSADDIQFFIRQQPPELITPDPPGGIEETLSAPSGYVSTLISPGATPSSPEPQEKAEDTTQDSSVQTSPTNPLLSVVLDNSDPQSSDTSSPIKQSSDALASSVTSSSSPTSSMPASDVPVTANSLAAIDVPSSSPIDSPNSPSTNSPSLPSTESPNVSSIDPSSFSSTNSPNVPSADSPSLPLADSPSLPSPYTPSLTSTNPTNVPSTDSASVQSSDSSHIPSTDTSASSILSTPSTENETTSESVQPSINPTLTTESTTTNATSSADVVPSELSFSVTLPPINIEETNIPQPSIASTEPLSAPDQHVTSDLKAPENTELHSVSSPVTSLDSTAVSNDTTSPMDGDRVAVDGEESQSDGDSSVVSTDATTEISPTVIFTSTSTTSAASAAPATPATSEVLRGEEIAQNATSSTNGLLPRGISEAMLALLVCSLTFGCVFLLTVVAVLGKRIYDGYQKRHYSRLDYLINGMYN